MRIFAWILIILPFYSHAQWKEGSIEGAVRDSSTRMALASASVSIRNANGLFREVLADKTGFFQFDSIPQGFYRLSVSFSGYSTFSVDSISVRPDKKDHVLGEIFLKPSATSMETIVIYAEKPLIQTKDGNITMNVAESPLSAGSNAADLLKNMPLVSADPDGKVTVRGREPRILVDEKPVDLNGMQLNDFLESLPGGMIEKIEIMTNPPAQYAQEPGGVINIVTRKGKGGLSGRVSVYGGTRGEAGMTGSMSYRKKGLAFSLNAGDSYNAFSGESSSIRENFYSDSSNQLHTRNTYTNISRRPNARFNLDYDLNARNAINTVLSYNGNNFDNDGSTAYANFNNSGENYRNSLRNILSTGNNKNPGASLTYTHKGRKEGEVLRLQGGWNRSWQDNNRYFNQRFFDGKGDPYGSDSIQSQFVNNNTTGINARIGYDHPFNKGMTIVSVGSAWNQQQSDWLQNSFYQDKNGDDIPMDLLSIDLGFTQRVSNLRGSFKHKFNKSFSFNSGLTWENTDIGFDLYKMNRKVSNSYDNFLPFAGFNFSGKGGQNMSLSYRRSIRRPGIRELNPSIDYTDPYNLRSGNPALDPTLTENFDLTVGKTVSKFYVNMGLGYNIVNNIFATVRTLIEDGKTLITWRNIDAKQEYEVSAWAGYNITRSFRLNASGGYTYNKYSEGDIKQFRYRNGASVSGKVSFSYAVKDIWNFTGNFNYNRFANPQGTVRSTVAMNLGIQKKFLAKKLIATFNMVDPIIQQNYRNTTNGSNFTVYSEGLTQTRNFRLTLTYNFKFKVV